MIALFKAYSIEYSPALYHTENAERLRKRKLCLPLNFKPVH